MSFTPKEEWNSSSAYDHTQHVGKDFCLIYFCILTHTFVNHGKMNE